MSVLTTFPRGFLREFWLLHCRYGQHQRKKYCNLMLFKPSINIFRQILPLFFDIIIAYPTRITSSWNRNDKVKKKKGLFLKILLYNCFVNLRIQSDDRKIRTRKNPVFGHFSCSCITRKYGFRKDSGSRDFSTFRRCNWRSIKYQLVSILHFFNPRLAAWSCEFWYVRPSVYKTLLGICW